MNSMTTSLSGYGLDKELPDGVDINNTTIGDVIPKPGYFTNISTTGSTSNITMVNGGKIRTGTTVNNTFTLSGYDTDGLSYADFITVTAGTSPVMAINAPAGTVVTLNNVFIGGITPTLAAFTTINFQNPITPVTNGVGSPYPISAVESNTLYTNEGATAKAYLTLPTAAAGLRYSFIVQDTDGLRIVANAGDTIRSNTSVSAAAGFAEATAIGATMTLVAINATEWISTSTLGTWTIT